MVATKKPTGAKPGRKRNAPIKSRNVDPHADIDDLIGEFPAEPPGDDLDKDGKPSTNMAVVLSGVTANWLAQVFGYDKNSIRKKLAAMGCPIFRQEAGRTYYLLTDAAPFLVKPKFEVADYIKSIRPSDLPPQLSETYWAAMLKRQKWEENAGHLWRTADVLEVFGDLSMTIKTKVVLWVEEVERHNGLTKEQRETIRQLSDNLLEDIYQVMVDAPTKKQTVATTSEADMDAPKSDEEAA